MYRRKENLNTLWISCQKNKCKIYEEEVKWSAVQICLNSVACFFDLERNKGRWRELALQCYWRPSSPSNARKRNRANPSSESSRTRPDFLEPISRWSNVMVTSKRGRQREGLLRSVRGGLCARMGSSLPPPGSIAVVVPSPGCTAFGKTFR